MSACRYAISSPSCLAGCRVESNRPCPWSLSTKSVLLLPSIHSFKASPVRLLSSVSFYHYHFQFFFFLPSETEGKQQWCVSRLVVFFCSVIVCRLLKCAVKCDSVVFCARTWEKMKRKWAPIERIRDGKTNRQDKQTNKKREDRRGKKRETEEKQGPIA